MTAEEIAESILHVFAARGNLEGMPHDWIGRDLPDLEDQVVVEAEVALDQAGLVVRHDLISYVELTPSGRRRVQEIMTP